MEVQADFLNDLLLEIFLFYFILFFKNFAFKRASRTLPINLPIPQQDSWDADTRSDREKYESLVAADRRERVCFLCHHVSADRNFFRKFPHHQDAESRDKYFCAQCYPESDLRCHGNGCETS